MICPHCATNLRRAQRPNRVCGSCRRPFAFDPKDNQIRAHDLKIGKIAGRLGASGASYTVTQLWYATARTSVSAASTRRLPAWVVLGLIGGVLMVCGLAAGSSGLAVVGGLLLSVTLVALVLRLLGVPHRRVAVPMSRAEFQKRLLTDWVRVYGAPPPGLIDPRPGAAPPAHPGAMPTTPAPPGAMPTPPAQHGAMPTPPAPPGAMPTTPVCAVLSPDPDVLACLHANGAPARLRLALAAQLAQLPPGVPVALLHDASVDGLLAAAGARTQLTGRRVADLGLRPQGVLGAKGAYRLREHPPQRHRLDWLLANGHCTAAERDWLAKGWWAPVAALRPEQLTDRVEAFAARCDPEGAADRAADRAAAAVGFLTWPPERPR